MNSIKRYRIEAECDVVLFNDDGVNVFGDIITDYKNNLWCKYSDVEQLQARIKELESAERTLISLGYENKGGETWKPPIRKRPNFNLIDSLNERIKELESDAHINEIKARAIEEAVEEAAIDCNVTDGPVIVLEKVRNYADKLRGKHD